jgi:chaperonin GroEL (HSP60 family)
LSWFSHDGITIAKEVELEVENNLSAAMVKEIAAKTSDSSDSSVYNTAEVLARAIATEGLKRLSPADQKALQDCLKQ